MGLFFVAHLYAGLIALFFMMGTVIGHQWAEKARDPNKEYNCPVVVFFRAAYFVVATVIGLIFIDTFIKEVFLGALGYGNIMHFLALLILLLVIGIQAIIGSVFVAPTRKGLITFAVVVATFIYLWEFYYPVASTDLEDSMIMGLLIPIAVGWGVQAILATIHGIYIKISKNTRQIRRDKRLWSIRKIYKKIFSYKLTVILFLLVLAEFLLSFEGYSLLSWMSFDLFFGIATGATGAIIILVIARKIRADRKLLKDEWEQKHFSRTDKLTRIEETLELPDGERLAAFIYKSITSPGEQDSVEEKPGPSILFLHGFGGFAQDIHFEPLLASLALAGYTVFAYDYRWSGHSKKPGQKGPFQGVMKEGSSLFEKMFSDAQIALDWVISHEDLVDPNRIAVVGLR